MAQSQSWPLSADINKRSGQCSWCRKVRQLHIKDGTVHDHGPRNNRCPGSHKPPYDADLSVGQQIQASQPLGDVAGQMDAVGPSTAVASQSHVSQPLAHDSSISDVISFPVWAVAPRPLVKHIPKSARSSCAVHLTAVINSIVSNPFDLSAWKSLFFWG